MKNIHALRGFGLSLVGFILIGGSFSSAALSTEQVFREFQGQKSAESSENGEIDPALLQASAEKGWQARMQQDLARREYHATPADPAPLRKALAAGLRGSGELASVLRDELLQSPNRTHDLRTYYLDDRVVVLLRPTDRPDGVLALRTEGIRRCAEPSVPLPSAFSNLITGINSIVCVNHARCQKRFFYAAPKSFSPKQFSFSLFLASARSWLIGTSRL